MIKNYLNYVILKEKSIRVNKEDFFLIKVFKTKYIFFLGGLD